MLKDNEMTREERDEQIADYHALRMLDEVESKLFGLIKAQLAENSLPNQKSLNEEEFKDGFHASLKYTLEQDEIERVFNLFDYYGVGYIDIRFMMQALGPSPGLGFDAPKKLKRRMLMEYDSDGDRLFDRSEFFKLVQDPKLKGWYRGHSHHVASDWDMRANERKKKPQWKSRSMTQSLIDRLSGRNLVVSSMEQPLLGGDNAPG